VLLRVDVPPALEVRRRSGPGGGAITAIVVHWRAPEWCAETVRSLKNSRGIDVRVVVVDNSAADDPYREVGCGEIVLRRENDGYSGGANAGLRWWLGAENCASEQHVVVACHDAVVDPTTLAALVSTIEQLPDLGVAGIGGGGERAVSPEGESWTVTPCPWVSGSLLLIRRQTLGSVGLFDARLSSYVEDVDFCFRAWDAGWKVAAVDDVRVKWHGWSGSDTARRLMLRNWLLLAWKRRGLAAFLVILAVECPPLLRSGVSRLLPWRSRARRRESGDRFKVLWAGVREGWCGRSAIRQSGGHDAAAI